MALAPQFAGHRLGSATSKHVLEVYVDFVCPFSAKQVLGMRDYLVPLLREKKSDTSIVLRQNPQPWHSSTTFVHEAVIAVSRLAATSEAVWLFVYALLEHQAEYYDDATQDEAPRSTRTRLAALAHEHAGVDTAQFLALVETGQGNSGNRVAADMKHQVKLARQNGIHVTPTVLLDGLVDPSVSSSFSAADWAAYVDAKLLP